nr:MAG TPA: hypothetical protein [Caudoviricetes sp.]
MKEVVTNSNPNRKYFSPFVCHLPEEIAILVE